MIWILMAVAGLLVWAGSTLIIDAWLERGRRLSLADRLMPYRPRSLGDEAQEYLQGR